MLGLLQQNTKINKLGYVLFSNITFMCLQVTALNVFFTHLIRQTEQKRDMLFRISYTLYIPFIDSSENIDICVDYRNIILCCWLFSPFNRL